MAEQYDVVIIGSGPAGRQAAKDLLKAGLTVAMAENYGFGGTCPLRGCEPKKLLVDAADCVARFRDMSDQGLSGEVEINWPVLMRFNRSFVDPASDRIESWLNQIGVDTYFGPARFVGPNRVLVDHETLEGRWVVVATGAEPRPINIPGREMVSVSDDFLELEAMPEKIVFIGGGFISFELGHLAARAGAAVTILEVFDRPLAPFDPDLVWMLVSATEKLGIQVRLSTPVLAVEKKGQRLSIRAGENGDQMHEADLVIHGAGRIPAIAGLDLEQGGVDYTEKGITVNEYMQSPSNPQVFAAGDAAATTHPLTPVATQEAAVAAHNIIHGCQKKINHYALPSSVFTYPVLAAVGLREDEAQRQGLKFKKIFQETAQWSEHKRIGLKHGGIKLLLDEDRDRLLGAHILGQRAEEMINILALAMQHDLTLSQLKETIWAYPSFTYNLRYVLP